MSTILKALRRLEEDRSAQAGRPLREQVASGPTEGGRGGLGWIVFGALAVGVGVGAAALAFLGASREAPPQEGVRSPVVQRQAPARAAESAAAPSAPPAELAPPPIVVSEAVPEPDLPPAALSSRVERLKRPPAEPRIAEPRPARRVPRRVASPRQAALAPQPEAVREPERPREPAPVREPVREIVPVAPPEDDPPVVARVPEVVAPAPAPIRPEPRAAEAPADSPRAEVPVVHVERTSWHPDSERRSARVQLSGGDVREIREGDAVGPLVVTAIEPSGVVFEHEGVEIRRRVGAE